MNTDGGRKCSRGPTPYKGGDFNLQALVGDPLLTQGVRRPPACLVFSGESQAKAPLLSRRLVLGLGLATLCFVAGCGRLEGLLTVFPCGFNGATS